MAGAAVGQPAWPGMLSRLCPAQTHWQQRCPSCPVVYCVYQTGGCTEKPNCPALLTSPGDEREGTNSFAELLRYLISSNCSWEDRGKERDSTEDGGKGKRMVETGKRKVWGIRWKFLGQGEGMHEEGKKKEGPTEE